MGEIEQFIDRDDTSSGYFYKAVGIRMSLLDRETQLSDSTAPKRNKIVTIDEAVEVKDHRQPDPGGAPTGTNSIYSELNNMLNKLDRNGIHVFALERTSCISVTITP